MKASEATAQFQALQGDQDLAITWWTKEEVTSFAKEFYDETLEVSDEEWVTAVAQFADDIGMINEQMWELITNIIKTNKGEQQ